MSTTAPIPPSMAINLDSNVINPVNTGYSQYNMIGTSYNQVTLGNVDQLSAYALNKIFTSQSSNDPNVFKKNYTPFSSAMNLTLDNYTVQYKGNDSVTPASLETRPNILNDYASYTYHIRLSMATERTAYLPDPNYQTLKRRIIAETGKTVGFNITKFIVTNTVSPGFKHQNMNVMTWQMTITEPFGLTLSDQMLSAARELEINNHSRYPIFIELWFDGYDDQGNIVTMIDGTYKIWRAVILECKLQTTQAGTVYELEGTTDNDLCTVNQFSMTRSLVNLNEITTLEKLTTTLTDILNTDAEKADGRKSITYSIKLPDEMKNWNYKPIDTNQASTGSQDSRGMIVPINRGQDIGAFIASAISKCEEADKFLLGVSGNYSGTSDSVESNGLARYIQIVPEMTITGYDSNFKDYTRLVTFNIVPFYTPKYVSTPKQAKHAKQLSVQQNKLAFWQKTKMINKKYEYIYTGKNTEILKFDINIENFWQIITPGYLGGRSYIDFTHGAVLAPDSFGVAENSRYLTMNKVLAEIGAKAAILDLVNNVTGGLANTASTAFNNFNTSLTGFNTTINALEGSIQNVAGSVNNISQFLGNLSPAASKFINIPASILQFDTSNYISFDTLVNKAQSIAPSTQTTTTQVDQLSQQTNRDRYIEELKKITYSATDKNDPDPLPVAFFTDNVPTAQNAGNNGEVKKTKVTPEIKIGGYPVGQGVFGSLMANMYDPHYFLEITLTIRGDPWWIGMTNLETNQYLVKKLDSGEITKNGYGYADFIQGENLFLLTFQTGTDYDEETGLMHLKGGSQYFNGLYSVLSVENHFENGSFTQVLSAYKEPFSQTIDKLLTPTVAPSNSQNTPAPNVPGIIQQQPQQAPSDLISQNFTSGSTFA